VDANGDVVEANETNKTPAASASTRASPAHRTAERRNGKRLLGGGYRSCRTANDPIVTGMEACWACKAELPPGARFCPSCGTRIHQVARAGEERKVVTVLFADLVGSTAQADQRDPEDVNANLVPFYQRMRAELEHFGGRVEKFIGDAVMALFGAPVAHEDDPERGVRAALAIRDAIAELNAQRALKLSVRVSVATGEAVIQLQARPEEGQGMAAGDIVNTAFRLAEAAPVNGILVDESTYRATYRFIEFGASDPVQAKGKAAPQFVWQAIAPRVRLDQADLHVAHAPLIGRQEELRRLLDVFDRIREERRPQLVTITGDPGIGKSRLILELVAELDARPGTTYWRQGRSLPYGEETPFWALAEILTAHAGILRADDPSVTERKLWQAVRDAVPEGAEAEWIVGTMRALVGLSGDAHTPGDRRSGEFAAWRRFFEGLAERRPLVIVFEDIHWADEGLLEFIDHLASQSSDVPLLIVCSARPLIFERHPGWGGGGQPSMLLELEPLSRDDTAALIAALLRDAVLPKDAERDLLTRAEGNPLYAQEYVRMLVDRGYLRRGADGWHLGRLEQLPLPESVQGIIAARLDALPLEEKSLVQSAAVVGRTFWFGSLATLSGLPQYAVGEHLGSLERKGFVRKERLWPAAGGSRYAFHHVLVRDVAYGQIPRARRAEKHRLAAEWLETLKSDRADLAELLAYHYQSALTFARAASLDSSHLTERTRLALREAGDRAAALNAWAAAKRLYAESIALWPRDAERARLIFHYGKAEFRAEGGGEAVLQEALRDLLVQGDSELAAEAEVILGELRFRHGDRDGAFARFEHAIALLADAPPSLPKAHALSTLSRFHSVALEPETAIRIGRQALKMAEDLGLDEVVAHALNNIGSARVAHADAGGIDDLERSLAITLAQNSPESVRTYLNLGTNLADLGDLRRTFAVHAEGRRTAERFGDRAGMQWFAAERLWELYWRGDWDEAAATSETLLADAEAGSPRSHSEPGARLVRGWIALPRGQLDAALQDATRLRDFARGARDLQSMFPALALRARILTSAGRDEEAREDAAELLRIWQQSEVGIGSYWTADLAFALSQLGRDEELLTSLAAAPSTPWVAAARAVATSEFEQAAALYAEIGSLPDEALARLCAARRLMARGRRDKANAELDRALAFHRRVGAKRYVQEGEAVLAAAR
jgi:class 3 adenylate cyclase/tetratricopeptide (TPR) repeat protein